jgi:hypothetical protein
MIIFVYYNIQDIITMVCKELTFEQSAMIGTIILSVIAIIIAIWSSLQTSREANQQIKEIIRLYIQQNKMFELMIESEISNALDSIRRSKQDIANIEAEIRRDRSQCLDIGLHQPDKDTEERKQLAENNIVNQTKRLDYLRKLQQAKTTDE